MVVFTIATNALFINIANFFFKCSKGEISCQPDLITGNFRRPNQQDLQKKKILHFFKTTSFMY